MSTPSTDVDICNLALSRISQTPVANVTSPSTPTEIVCKTHYDQARRALLRRYVFNFSKKYAVLTADSDVTPAFGWTTAYDLPNDFLRLLAIGDVTVNGDVDPIFYEFVEDQICSSAGDSSGLKISYIMDATDVTTFDPLFVEALYLSLAKAFAYKFALKESLRKSIEDELKDVLMAAAAVSGQEKPPRRIQHSRVRDIRRTRGIFRDNTRI